MNNLTFCNQKFLLLTVILLLTGLISCKDDDVEKSPLAEVQTSETKNIQMTAAMFSGEVKSEGQSAVIQRGFCWSEYPLPTVNDNFSENEFGPGPFTHAAGNLKAGVVYYVRTYAQNGQGTAYGNEVSFSTKAFALGDTGIAGGTIFFDKGSYSDGWRYLEAATEDFEIINWGCLAMDIPGTMDAVGSGAANTVLITSKCKEAGIAARRCSDLVLNEYDDWFLPSKGELTLMYENLRKKGLGNLSGLVYWSSTQISIYDAIALDPSTGMQFSLNKMDARYSFARAIRAF